MSLSWAIGQTRRQLLVLKLSAQIWRNRLVDITLTLLLLNGEWLGTTHIRKKACLSGQKIQLKNIFMYVMSTFYIYLHYIYIFILWLYFFSWVYYSYVFNTMAKKGHLKHLRQKFWEKFSIDLFLSCIIRFISLFRNAFLFYLHAPRINAPLRL